MTGRYLAYGRDGVFMIDADGTSIELMTSPAAVALAVGDSLLLVQEPDEGDVYPPHRGWTFEVHRPSSEPALAAVSNRQLRLFDAGVVEGRPVALATLINWAGQDTYEDLLLVDLEASASDDSGDVFTTIARVGGWESLVTNARLSGDLVVLSTATTLAAWSLTGGELVWARDLFGEPRPFVVTDSEVMLITSRFEEPGFRPFLDLTTYSLADGDILSETSLELDAEFDGGFCLRPDWDGLRLVCDETYGGPFAVDLSSGQIERLSDLAHGMPSVIEP